MRVLLIGPQPPPHGGISVHVSGIRRHLVAAAVPCNVLDMSLVRPGFEFGLTILRHALAGWTLHLHTNGHNVKSWLLALACGLAGQSGGGCILTLHSGMLPGYLATAPLWRRRLAALTCSLYRQVICVSPDIRRALLAHGVESRRVEVLPAFLGSESPGDSPESKLVAWIGLHRPLFSTVLFFRPEYGFNLLVASLTRLRGLYPSFGCLVMGSGEQQAEAVNRVREAGLEENILLLGDVNHDACLAIMSASDVFLRPTLEDGDSMSVREALALGVPVVASRVGTRPAGAILFRAGDVEELLASVELAITVSRGNQLHAAGCMNRLMEIYRQVDGPEGSTCLN
ncbi:MAG: glycosyltransferase family 4 protein [Acidobacteria bacterium]|nr:glycosyltransferase family 4 protein [Acidobacteriota bacterium]